MHKTQWCHYIPSMYQISSQRRQGTISADNGPFPLAAYYLDAHFLHLSLKFHKYGKIQSCKVYKAGDPVPGGAIETYHHFEVIKKEEKPQNPSYTTPWLIWKAIWPYEMMTAQIRTLSVVYRIPTQNLINVRRGRAPPKKNKEPWESPTFQGNVTS